jgi:hypothetical protein
VYLEATKTAGQYNSLVTSVLFLVLRGGDYLEGSCASF